MIRKRTLDSSLFDYLKLSMCEKEQSSKETVKAYGYLSCTSRRPLLKYTRQLVNVAFKNRFTGDWAAD